MINYYKKKFIEFINDNGLVNYRDKIVIGVSGGPDSICLLNLLCLVKEEYNLDIAVAHINHMIRGIEADEDEVYCKSICEKLKVKCYVKKINIKEMAKNKKISEEACGREVRYDFFNEIKNKLGYNKIATAHNANDQAETIIMRIMRGTGLDGLGGIPINRDNIYIRPIIFMKRNEVEDFCMKIGETPHIDCSNLEKVYSRNKIRLDILPYMKENFNEDIIDTINRMGEIIQIDNSFIEQSALEEYKKDVIISNNEIILNKNVFNLHKALIGRIIRKSIENLNGNKYNIEMKHINEIQNLAILETSKKIDLPNNLYGINIYGNIHIRVRGKIEECYNGKIIIKKDELDYIDNVEYNGEIFKIEIVNYKSCINYNENTLTKYFNYDNINGDVILRYRKDGDRIIPFGMDGSKKLKDVFINMKIPKEIRDHIPLVEINNEIAWIVGVKISEKFKITKDTKKLLKISVIRKEI